MPILSEQEKKIPLWVLIPFKVLGALFGAIAAFTLVTSIILPLSPKTPVLVTYIVMDVTMMLGFWGMRKWIVTLSGITLAFLVVNDGIRLARGAQVTNSMLIALAIMGALLLFTFALRSRLDGSYDNRHPFRVFITALVVSQLLMFLK